MNPKTDGGYGSPQSIFETSTTQHHRVGTRLSLDDRVFRYARFVDTTAIGPNKLAQMCPPWANHVTETGTLSGGTAGSTQISVVLGATAANENEYGEGYLKIESATSTGAGQIFKLRGHAAVSSGGTLTADLYDPITTAVSGTVTWSLIHNPWADIVIQPTTITAPAAGVTMVNWAATTSATPYYGWVQTWGPASCLIDTTAVVAGSGLIVGAVAGSLGVAVESDIKQRVAMGIEAIGTDNIYASVFLQVSP